MSEDRWLADALGDLRDAAHVRVGPGDDAALLSLSAQDDVVVATDVLVDGVHFDVAECGPALAARKALAVNLSDLAAMGAAPTGFLVGAVLPRPVSRALFDGLMQSFRSAAEDWSCPLLGGDTNSADGPLVLSVTVLGTLPSGAGLLRSGGRAGDTLSVTGPLGGSRSGRHLTFEPRLVAGAALAATEGVHAMMDLSDGLSRDLPRLCKASGVGALIDAADVPIHADAAGSLERALHEGEDFELLVAHRPLAPADVSRLAEAGTQLHAIGALTEGHELRLRTPDGARPLKAGGWDHLAG